MTQIYLIRHAEAEGNLYRRIQGQTDTRITPAGFRQLTALEHRFHDIHLDAVYYSGLNRTRLTARAIAGPHGLPLREDRRLIEVDLGPWEDKPVGEISAEWPESLRQFTYQIDEWHLDGAESYSHLTDRFMQALSELACRHDGQAIAVCTHGGILRASLGRMFPGQKSVHPDNTAVSLITWDHGEFRPIFLNDNSHLGELSTLNRQGWVHGQKEENFRFCPLKQEDGQTYIRFRKDAWDVVYPGVKGFDGPGFLADARRSTQNEPQALVFAMEHGQIAGLLQLNMLRGKEKNAGYISFFYLKPEYRGRRLGVQLVGHAVSVFRSCGRSVLQLSVAPTNSRAISLYRDCGFTIIEPARRWRHMSLHLMQMDLGTNQTFPE